MVLLVCSIAEDILVGMGVTLELGSARETNFCAKN